MRASKRHLAPGSPVAHGGGEVIFDANLSERMRLEELFVRVAKMQTPSSETLEFSARDDDGDSLASASQFHFDA